MPQAPRLCPAVPRSCSVSAPSPSASGPRRRTISPESSAPIARSVLCTVALERQPLAARERVAGERRAPRGRAAPRAPRPGRRRSARRPSGPTAVGEQRAQVDAGAAVAGLARELGAADEIVEAPHAELRHQLAHLLGHEQEVLDDVLRRAGEAAAQLGILRGDAHRAGVEVADAHHDAARRDQRCGREAELLGAEQRADDDVAAACAGRRRPAAARGRAGRCRPAPAASRRGRAPRARRRGGSTRSGRRRCRRPCRRSRCGRRRPWRRRRRPCRRRRARRA